jgi:hemolysin D
MADTTDKSIAIQSADLGTESQASAMKGAYAHNLDAAKSNYQWPAAAMIRILIVDDQKSIRERLKFILEPEPDFEIVGMVDNGYDAIEQVKNIQPDVVLMDMEMPDIDGVLATKIISHSDLGKKVRVLVLSSHDTNEYVARSIHAGAKGYLLKGASPEEIQDAVRFVHRGYTQIAPGLFEQFIPELPAKSSGAALSQPRPIPTELDVTGLSGLAITGFKIQRRVSDTPVLAEPEASEMLIDIAETRIGSKSASWAQVAAGITLAVGAIGSIYLVRQGLQQPQGMITVNEKASKLQETPFTGKIEAQQTNKINATVPGFVQEVKVKVGQTVKQGDVLMTIRNVEAERSNQEKSQQQQQQAAQQQQSQIQQQQSQQQALLQQQQALIQQQQQSQQRSSVLEQQLTTQNSIVTPLRNQLASASLQVDEGQLQASRNAKIQEQQEIVQSTRYEYSLQQNEYEAKIKTYNARLQLFESGGIAQEQVNNARSEMNAAKIRLNAIRSKYENAQQALNEAKNNRSQPAQSQKLRLQQQLALKEQEERIRKLQELIQQERLNYQQLSTNLQALRQRSLVTPSPLIPIAGTSNQPVLINITAATNGSVVELPVNTGDQVFTGNKLVTIANPQQLKTTVEVDEKLASTIQVGRRTFVKIKNGSDVRDYTGRVANISPTGENRKQKVEVEFQVGNDFFVGQPATIYFPTK